MRNVETQSHSAFRIQHFAFRIQHFAVPLLAIFFLAVHLPYLPASLEDLDSINFAFGIRHFDVAQHNPHPPGYPVFIAIAKVVHAAVPSEAKALALVAVVAGTLGVLAIAALFARLGSRTSSGTAVLGVALAIAAPLYWFTANRPLSDMAGLAAAIAVQALILRAETTKDLAIASFLAAFAVGVRSQVLWLTAPLLGWTALKGCATRRRSVAQGFSPAIPAAYIAGALAWAVPLVVLTGGPHGYWRAVFSQGAEDLSGIRMLWTTPTVRESIDALYYAFVAPWATWPLATIVLLLAALGLATLWRRDPGALSSLAIAFVPYLLFDLVFQETFTSRYALPLVIPIAFLAAAGTRAIPANGGLAIAIGVAMFGAHVGGTSLAAYARQPTPAFRLLDDMATATAAQPPVLAMDRREAFDLRKAMTWAPSTAFEKQLPSPPQHEWLELVHYWNAGGRSPVWFVADPKRTDIELIGHDEPKTYRWGLPYPVLIDGVRPNEMDWYRIESPRWYVGEGWALTPEAAGVSHVDGALTAPAYVEAWVSRRTIGGAMLIGGRNLSNEPATITVDTGNRLGFAPLPPAPYQPESPFVVEPGFFARVLHIPNTEPPPPDYTKIRLNASAPGGVAFEQFDMVDRDHPIMGYGRGWYEAEYNPITGVRWRWMSDRGELILAKYNPPVVLHIEGESPRKYFKRDSRLVVRSGTHVLLDQMLRDDFELTIPVDHPTDTLVLETDQTYVPAERSRRTQDRRRLGLRILICELTTFVKPASLPDK
jgi:hypothetical protein